MFESLPEDILRGIEAAQRRAVRRGSRLNVQAGDHVLPILRLWEGGFSVDAARSPRLRGLVDIYDGPRHLSQALIIAAGEEGGEMTYEFKRDTAITASPIRDYVEDRGATAGYLTGPV